MAERKARQAVMRGAAARGSVVRCVLLAVGGAAVVGCDTPGKRDDVNMYSGQYGLARRNISAALTDDRGDRSYMLDRLNVSIATLADGQPRLAEPTIQEMYSILAKAGVNKDKTISAFLTSESAVKIWKGEPFEQAYAYSYISIQRAMADRWDEALGAAKESLFLLKDFGESRKGTRKTTEDIARTAVEAEQAGKGSDFIDKGYQPVETNFTLGYVLAGIAAQAESKAQEARDNFARAVQYNEGLRPLVDVLASRSYNTVFVVDCGQGPMKEAYGTDNAFSRFVPRTSSDLTGLQVNVVDTRPSTSVVPVVIDANMTAVDHLWNNMEDVNVAKSRVGTALLIGGVGAMAVGNNMRGDAGTAVVAVGAAMALFGAIQKASAHADTRYCYYLPQRVYVVPVTISDPNTTVVLSVPGHPVWTMVLPGLQPPRRENPIQLRYVKMPDSAVPVGEYAPVLMAPPAWATSGKVFYASDEFVGAVEGDGLPYILGGRCVKTPSAATLKYYQDRGNLRDMTLNELEDLYRQEGIYWDTQDIVGRAVDPKDKEKFVPAAVIHVLDGGRSLVPPKSGTVAYARLFGQVHRPYIPRSQACRSLAEKYSAAVSSAAVNSAAR